MPGKTRMAPLFGAAVAVAVAVAAAATAIGGEAEAAVAPPTVDASSMRVETIERSDAAKEYRVLFLGNSITRHGPSERLGWTNNCGMAASEPAKDYVHRFRALAAARLPADTGMTTLFSAVGGGRLKPHLGRMDEWRAARPDLVVVQLGENDRFGDDGLEGFRKDYETLLDQLLSLDPKPAVVCMGVWMPGDNRAGYAPGESKDTAIRDAAAARGLPFASVAAYATDPDCRGFGEVNGVRWHPNDRGMEGYAAALLSAWKPAP